MSATAARRRRALSTDSSRLVFVWICVYVQVLSEESKLCSRLLASNKQASKPRVGSCNASRTFEALSLSSTTEGQ